MAAAAILIAIPYIVWTVARRSRSSPPPEFEAPTEPVVRSRPVVARPNVETDLSNRDPPELSSHELADAVRSFIDHARIAEDRLRDFMVAEGMRPVDRTLAHCWHGLVEQLGHFPDGGGYFFHGIGCEIGLPGELVIDFDWTEHGAIVVDAWRVQPWIEGRWGARVDVDAINSVMATLMHGGELVVGDWPSQVAVANDV